ncbi:hypothetical protein F8E02_00535 [Methanoculleus sp. Wushi-C6]|uniref:Uncharacterized protein n=1 Tax=Methanoculleus caldifontis TaxID=2651577 RepID=A0ABU3WXH8_9EURY|nr:hypothetical protein [Methanoculleus sp. Wushi-C6]MDV2480514.1 hypothetical protein [Methanoculleus sp. Wushi-C6]
MDPRFRARLVAAIILLIVVCSIFSVSPVAGFRLENRDGSGTEAALAEALVLQQSTKIRDEYMENLTVYIDSRNEKFRQQDASDNASGVSGLYAPDENAIYIRSDRQPERADDVFVQQVGYRVYHTMGFDKSTVLPDLEADAGTYLTRITPPPGEERQAAVFAEAFMLYHTSPALLEEDAPGIYAYMDLLVKNGGDYASIDGLYIGQA